VPAHQYGARARRLAKLRSLDLPVPLGFVISVETVRNIAEGRMPDVAPLLAEFGAKGIVSVRSSPVMRDWGGPESQLNIGLNEKIYQLLCNRLGQAAATALYCRFVQDYSINVARLDEAAFAGLGNAEAGSAKTLRASVAIYEEELDEAFPQDPRHQLTQVLRSMARAWQGTSARILRQARGAPADAGLGLIVQRMALGLGAGESGAGVVQFSDPDTGKVGVSGRYLTQSQGRDALIKGQKTGYIAIDARGASLQEASPNALKNLRSYAKTARIACRDAVRFDFTLEDNKVWLLDATPAVRNSKAAVQIAVDLVKDKAISQQSALLRLEPRNLTELLHPQVDAKAEFEIFASGIAASPGAVTGAIVFTATAAQASAARGEPCILVRRETGPEDIRGLHSANGVLTERGGMTSHAAVIAKGLGLPCVVGASGIKLHLKAKTVICQNDTLLAEGDIITVDGTTGKAMIGPVAMSQPDLGGAFATFMGWARTHCDIGIRTNADSPTDARLAQRFGVDGIGLCRTEHMFFKDDRLTVMREMIMADNENDRRVALDLLLPMQRSDFIELFEIMGDNPVCIRLFDPPLHEFLPHSRDEMRELAEAMGLPISRIIARTEDLAEFNPMLGMRGVRLGITIPEIYEIQARAIFEAAVHCTKNGSKPVPEVMIPLVSAHREVEMVKARLDGIAAAVQIESGVGFDYHLGAMVETPRAALRAGDLASSSAFLSFGTNDLTQMAYGLSRDDSGRFMRDYVNQQVFAEDPFQTLDIDGVGELLLLAAKRGRAANQSITLSLCGEHGADPASIAFCREAGFDYVSCSPFRVPIARLAAAQCAVRDGALGDDGDYWV